MTFNLKSEIKCPGSIRGILHVGGTFLSTFSLLILYQGIPRVVTLTVLDILCFIFLLCTVLP